MENVRYWAFLSHCPSDRRETKRLQHRLEGYRLPDELVGRRGRDGIVPARLRPVFADPVHSLPGNVIGAAAPAALSMSRALVVMCSPAAAASPVVEADVAAFEQLQPGGLVVCVLLDGEPLASRDPGCVLPECLPPSLGARFAGMCRIGGPRHVIDLRPHGDGWRLGIEKLVAALAGVPLEILVEQDLHRRRRRQRLAWLSVVAATLALGSGLAVLMVRQAGGDGSVPASHALGAVGSGALKAGAWMIPDGDRQRHAQSGDVLGGPGSMRANPTCGVGTRSPSPGPEHGGDRWRHGPAVRTAAAQARAGAGVSMASAG